MAEDIVVRLNGYFRRRYADAGKKPHDYDCLPVLARDVREAADTIEQLRRDLAEADENARKKYAPCD